MPLPGNRAMPLLGIRAMPLLGIRARALPLLYAVHHIKHVGPEPPPKSPSLPQGPPVWLDQPQLSTSPVRMRMSHDNLPHEGR